MRDQYFTALSGFKLAAPASLRAALRRTRAAHGLAWTCALLLLLTTTAARAQQRRAPLFFQEDLAARSAAATSPLAAALQHARPLSIDAAGLRASLATAPLEGRAGASPL